ncbi:hypothetical protein SBD_1399 [Streptomyces bottropensis ATCC 25435]|uniref:Uncharacterized protein n=1 Tax=Streptomyces bottropensis ATCC 25435 TaxID=1054862 RepID=M3DK56_9ACTN|nr:hypothetical protein SBD_1399 [Streptomyces bottropensis ATCC 25435]
MRGRKPRHSSSLTLGLSSRCGRIVGRRSRSKQCAASGIGLHMPTSK